MNCPSCGYSESNVTDSRPAINDTIRRRRICQECGYRFTTYERIEMLPVFVVKSNGRKQTFSRDKIIRGMLKACEKRPVSLNQIEDAANRIEAKVIARDNEITAQMIGDMVMEELLRLDQIGYVRFASVYHQFMDIETFASEIQKILKRC